jgi:HEAT repeat protein
MATFGSLLAEIKRDCGWEHVPYDKISEMAKLCGPAEVAVLISELDALNDADLEDDAGDIGDEYCRLRTSYTQALTEVGTPAIELLLNALQSKNPHTRSCSGRALGRIGATQAFVPLVNLLTIDFDFGIRLEMMRSLGELRDPRAIQILLPYLKAPEQINRGWIVRTAANALGKIGSTSVIEPLTEVLCNDPDWFARLGAAEGLRKIRHPNVRQALQTALDDVDERVRKEAATGLEEL